jgi:hypothetical protein
LHAMHPLPFDWERLTYTLTIFLLGLINWLTLKFPVQRLNDFFLLRFPFAHLRHV